MTQTELQEEIIQVLTELAAVKADNERLSDALKKYTRCSHACQECFCTKEARAALYKP